VLGDNFTKLAHLASTEPTFYAFQVTIISTFQIKVHPPRFYRSWWSLISV